MISDYTKVSEQRAYDVAGVTVVKKYDEQSAVPCLVVKADATTALRPATHVIVRIARTQCRDARRTVISIACCSSRCSSNSCHQEENLNQNGIHR